MEKSRDHRLVAATILAVATLGIFAALRDYGPESAVRRFHHAVAEGDGGREEIAQIVTQAYGTTAVQQLIAQLRSLGGQKYRIETETRTDERVDMLALYGTRRIVWVVVKGPGTERWRIDPYLTLQGLRKLQRLGY